METKAPRLSVVIPLFNEAASLTELHQQLVAGLQELGEDTEIIFINDGSDDGSQQELETLATQDQRIRIVEFQKNFGKSAALSVGFAAARGELVVTLDADLQDDPREIPALVAKIMEGYDLVSGWKKKRRDPLSKKIPSRIYNFITALLSGVKIHDINCGLKIYRCAVAKHLHPYGEMHRYLPVMAHLAGFRIGELPVNHRLRKYGKTKFGFSRFTGGFFDLITLMFLTRYMKKPLHLFGSLGLLSFFAGLAISTYLTIQRLFGVWIANRPLFFLGILLLIVGGQFISLGLLGEMITESQKTRQDYAIRKLVGLTPTDLQS